MDVQKHSVHTLMFRSLKRTHEFFLSEQNQRLESDDKSYKMLVNSKIQSQYAHVKDIVDQQQTDKKKKLAAVPNFHEFEPTAELSSTDAPEFTNDSANQNNGLAMEPAIPNDRALVKVGEHSLLVPRKVQTTSRPTWHAPWKLSRVLSGHLGWVRCIAVEPGNEWFVTGSADRVIKIWDMYTCTLKLSLTGHVSAVRGVAVGVRQPYLFTCGEDKQVKCWDLEYNKVIRSYHGHLSAVSGLDLHPTLDVLVSCGRDATARLWDMRTKVQIHCLTGHTDAVSQVKCQASEPQIITSSYDKTVRLWDITAGRTKATLTHHKKSVRSLVLHPLLNMMVTGSSDNLKQWAFPDGIFMQNLSGHNAIINCLAVNSDNVLVSGGDNGSVCFWDWNSGYNFQRLQTAVQPGSIESEAGLYAMTFDVSGSRLITCEADKTIKIYKEDDTATEESHPLNWKSEIISKRR